MGKQLTLILGGARSGKSTYAQTVAEQCQGRVLFVATALAFDDEMRARIRKHQAERPENWPTLEAPTGVGAAIQASPENNRVNLVLLDCLTLLANNVILALDNPDAAAAASAEAENASDQLAAAVQSAMDAEVDHLLAAYAQSPAEWLIVSNEVGLGLVPPYPLGRIYRDALGRANQRIAQAADHVLFMVAGIPMKVK